MQSNEFCAICGHDGPEDHAAQYEWCDEYHDKHDFVTGGKN